MIEVDKRQTMVKEENHEACPPTGDITPATRLALILTLRLDHETNAPNAAEQSTRLRPLDAGEMNRLARWLHDKGRDALMLPSSPESLLDGWQDAAISAERILALVARQETIDRTVQRWTELGVWVLGRKDPGYPRTRLSARLGEAIPPVLFGIGDASLLERGGTAIVGSRDTQVSTLNLAQSLGAVEGQSGRTVISGGARGVDERAVQGAFLGNGSAVIILGDGLARQIGKRAHAEHLAAGTLALISPYAPSAAFSTANAMGRNRLIYCMADETIVVASSEGTGGTFIGARDALRRGWGPIWIAPTDDPNSGNPLLLRAGGQPLAERTNGPTVHDAPPTVTASPVTAHTSDTQRLQSPTPSTTKPGDALYAAFIACWRMLPTIPAALPDLARGLSLTPEQTRTWVFQAVERGDATRLAGPTRYVVSEERAT